MKWLKISLFTLACFMHLNTSSFWGGGFAFNKPDKNYYDTVGVDYNDPNLTLAQLKKAYQKKAITMHPDKGGNEDDFKQLGEAYEEITKYLNSKDPSAAQNPQNDPIKEGADRWLTENNQIKNAIAEYFRTKTSAETFYTEQIWDDILNQDAKAYQSYHGSWYNPGLPDAVKQKIKDLIRQQIDNQRADKDAAEQAAHAGQDNIDTEAWFTEKQGELMAAIENLFHVSLKDFDTIQYSQKLEHDLKEQFPNIKTFDAAITTREIQRLTNLLRTQYGTTRNWIIKARDIDQIQNTISQIIQQKPWLPKDAIYQELFQNKATGLANALSNINMIPSKIESVIKQYIQQELDKNQPNQPKENLKQKTIIWFNQNKQLIIDSICRSLDHTELKNIQYRRTQSLQKEILTNPDFSIIKTLDENEIDSLLRDLIKSIKQQYQKTYEKIEEQNDSLDDLIFDFFEFNKNKNIQEAFEYIQKITDEAGMQDNLVRKRFEEELYEKCSNIYESIELFNQNKKQIEEYINQMPLLTKSLQDWLFDDSTELAEFIMQVPQLSAHLNFALGFNDAEKKIFLSKINTLITEMYDKKKSSQPHPEAKKLVTQALELATCLFP